MPGPFIIIEGPDGGGKTTLAERIAAHGPRYLHLGPPEELAVDAWRAAVRPAFGRHVVDRLHVGSFVYGRAFRGLDDMYPFERWHFDGELYAYGTRVVFARPPDEVMTENLRRGPDNADAEVYEDPARRQRVRDLYDLFFDPVRSAAYLDYSNQLETSFYDYTRDDVDEFAAAEVEEIEALRQTPRIVLQSVKALGNVWTPRFVFVGDEPNENLGHDDPFYSASGRYLHAALSTAGLSWSDYAIVNSRQLNGRTIDSFVTDYGRELDTSWVALGQMADRRLTFAGLDHRVVPHPQFVKRFAFKRGLVEYPKALVGAAEWHD